ncbi:MAG: PVC-type heme-binding CxxCH protein [Gemmataceae bacterium]
MRFASAVALLMFASVLRADDGVLPVGADGKPLNLDFETGTLKDWIVEGDAFARQPIEGDTVSVRRKDMKSRHQGKYWIGGWERGGGDKGQGTLTSIPFKVTHPWCSFLVGGGPYPTTAVEIGRADTTAVFSRTSGLAEEDMRRVAVDLRNHQGKEIFVRLVDRHTGHWGHVNFDDFRFHAEEPKLPPRPEPRESLLGQTDQFKHAGLPPEQAAAAMTVPEGFTVTLFAGEPDVKQPIAFCIDDRGRLWVAEAYDYPIRQPEGKGHDRILIFEDTNGDGKFDKRTVFMEGLNLVSGLEVGFGGVWIGAAPYLMYVPLDPSGDKPAGKPQILLDGWGYQDTHETLNTFTWAPDGWLWGCHGVFTHAKVGKPGTPDAERTLINAGIWRYHPTRHVFEVVAHGTSNPWGLDFNERGEAFIEACVIPHCYHIVPGGRYERQAGSHFNPYTYADIKTIADHRHYLGANPHGGNNRSDAAGGGHAHCGLMCYLGGAWPEEYRGKLYMGNIHGRRINTDVLISKGSGYVASHGKDFLLANDAWARFINLKYGPTASVMH